MNIIDGRSNRPILVTGSHRSGSTWVGQMIARAPSVAYIHEPFNIKPEPGHFGGEFASWFTYVCDDNADQFEAYVRRCLELKYPLSTKLRASKSPANWGRSLVSWARFVSQKRPGQQPLMKDPLAVFSADWLARKFDMQVIVLTRHPAAFAGSLKKAGWSHPFDHFLDQPLLMRDHLADFRPQIELFAEEEQDIIDQAILLWNMIHSVIYQYHSEHPDWMFVRHEDISLSPVEQFGAIYDYLGLHYSDAIQEEIATFSRADPVSEADDLLSIKRDSRYNLGRWKDRLTEDEIERIGVGTSAISHHFYSPADW